MSDKTVEERVCSVIADRLQIDQSKIKPESDLKKEPKFNLLDLIDIWIGLEDEFGISIPDEDFEATGYIVSKIVACIENKVA